MKQRISDIITINEIEKWNDDNIILISAETGAGKSYFIKHVLSDYAQIYSEKILLLENRITTVEQAKQEIQTDSLTVRTYQSLEYQYRKYHNLDLTLYDYIVCDEYHYFSCDSSFNDFTDISFNEIMRTRAKKLFMSATGDCMIDVLRDTLKAKKRKVDFAYRLPITFDFIKDLYFYWNLDNICDLLDTWRNTDQKAIIFVSSIQDGLELFQKFEKISMFLCSKANKRIYENYVDENKCNLTSKTIKSDKQNAKNNTEMK